jgi:hypothetical protein
MFIANKGDASGLRILPPITGSLPDTDLIQRLPHLPLNSPATASSYQKGNEPRNGDDGDPETRSVSTVISPSSPNI